MRKTILIFIVLLLSNKVISQVVSFEIIPLPKEIKLEKKLSFILDETCYIEYKRGNELLRQSAQFLANYIKEASGYTLKIDCAEGFNKVQRRILLELTSEIIQPEGYSIKIRPKEIVIKASTPQGIFYGLQTLRSSLPHTIQKNPIQMPCGYIEDAPHFDYRGMHLDVSRHFFSIDFIKKYVDILALHKMNTLHLHLTDDQGWRIEIKKYPLLTQIGSVRKHTVIGKNSGKYDGKVHQGYYTQEQLKDLIAYAAQRHVTIIPEIDLPGHMLAVLAAYPELGCTGGPYEVSPTWGVFQDVLCIGNKKSMEFLKNVMDEIVKIFPSKFIHIGGDEAPRTRWRECPKCQSLIKKMNLKNGSYSPEDFLQSYCMSEIEKYLNQKGRTIIGWDEILKGDVAPNAVVMSWQGISGGIKAAQMEHQVIMAPNSHCYLNYYQYDNIYTEPFAIGGYIPLQKIYELNPTLGLSEKQARFVLGVEGALWTEYITTPQEAEYMLLPRIAALAEVQWRQPEKKNYKAFQKRVAHQTAIYEKYNWEYAKHLFNLEACYKLDTQRRAIVVMLDILGDKPIYYTTDGSIPTSRSQQYKDSIVISGDCDFKAISITKQGSSNLVEEKINFHKAMLKPISLNATPHIENTFAGAITLVDGVRGKSNYSSGSWIGFDKGDVIADINLEEITSIKKIEVGAYVDVASWIMGSSGIIIETSLDGKNFRQIAQKEIQIETDIHAYEIENYKINFAPTEARYLRIIIKRSPALPKGHIGEGYAPLIFLDEIIVE